MWFLHTFRNHWPKLCQNKTYDNITLRSQTHLKNLNLLPAGNTTYATKILTTLFDSYFLAGALQNVSQQLNQLSPILAFSPQFFSIMALALVILPLVAANWSFKSTKKLTREFVADTLKDFSFFNNYTCHCYFFHIRNCLLF